jgi:uncharacterized protein (TIGR00369 family)
MTDQSRTRTYSWQDPMPTAQAAQTMRGLDFLNAMLAGQFPKPPIAETLDFTLIEVSEGHAVFGGTPAEFHYNPIGMVHGGLVATLLDSALGCAVQTTLPAGMAYTTLELHVNLTRALTKDTGEIRVEANVLHAGRRMATAEAKVFDMRGKLYGHGTTTCLVFPVEG